LSAGQSPLLSLNPAKHRKHPSMTNPQNGKRRRAGPASRRRSARQQSQHHRMTELAFRVRAARPTDVPALMRFKRLLAESEGGLHTVRATAADWLRDGFGPRAGFAALVAEPEYKRGLIGMATYSERIITGWSGPSFFCRTCLSRQPIAATAWRAR
jgi:hypothetical protein